MTLRLRLFFVILAVMTLACYVQSAAIQDAPPAPAVVMTQYDDYYARHARGGITHLSARKMRFEDIYER